MASLPTGQGISERNTGRTTGWNLCKSSREISVGVLVRIVEDFQEDLLREAMEESMKEFRKDEKIAEEIPQRIPEKSKKISLKEYEVKSNDEGIPEGNLHDTREESMKECREKSLFLKKL